MNIDRAAGPVSHGRLSLSCDEITGKIESVYPEYNAADLQNDPDGYLRQPDTFALKYHRFRQEITSSLCRCYLGGTVSAEQVNTPADSWLSVVKGLRPMGQFSVFSLCDPLLHALNETPEIGVKCLRKQGNITLYIILVYRRDSDDGEQKARDFIALMAEKKRMMESGAGTHEERVFSSEYQLSRRFGELLSYHPADIDRYEAMMKNKTEILREGHTSGK